MFPSLTGFSFSQPWQAKVHRTSVRQGSSKNGHRDSVLDTNSSCRLQCWQQADPLAVRVRLGLILLQGLLLLPRTQLLQLLLLPHPLGIPPGTFYNVKCKIYMQSKFLSGLASFSASRPFHVCHGASGSWYHQSVLPPQWYRVGWSTLSSMLAPESKYYFSTEAFHVDIYPFFRFL